MRSILTLFFFIDRYALLAPNCILEWTRKRGNNDVCMPNDKIVRYCVRILKFDQRMLRPWPKWDHCSATKRYSYVLRVMHAQLTKAGIDCPRGVGLRIQMFTVSERKIDKMKLNHRVDRRAKRKCR